jgi:hypothetical protein
MVFAFERSVLVLVLVFEKSVLVLEGLVLVLVLEKVRTCPALACPWQAIYFYSLPVPAVHFSLPGLPMASYLLLQPACACRSFFPAWSAYGRLSTSTACLCLSFIFSGLVCLACAKPENYGLCLSQAGRPNSLCLSQAGRPNSLLYPLVARRAVQSLKLNSRGRYLLGHRWIGSG